MMLSDGSKFGVVGGVKGGIPGMPVTNLVGQRGPAIATKPPKQEAVANKPLSVVMARAV